MPRTPDRRRIYGLILFWSHSLCPIRDEFFIAGLACSPLAAQATGSERYRGLVAGQFPLRSGRIRPSPRVVSGRVTDLLRDEDADVSFPNRAEVDAMASESRAKVAEHPGVSAVATAIDFHRAIGADVIEARTTALANALKEGLAGLNRVKMVTPMDPRLSGGIVIAQIPHLDRPKMAALVKELYDKYGIAGAATGGLRLSPHIYNSMDDVQLAIRAVRELAG